MQLTDKNAKTINAGERYKSFICSFDATDIPSSQGEGRPFFVLPEGLSSSLGSQLLDTSVFGLGKAWGLGEACEGLSSLCLHQM